jgi:hypothetical protein
MVIGAALLGNFLSERLLSGLPAELAFRTGLAATGGNVPQIFCPDPRAMALTWMQAGRHA